MATTLTAEDKEYIPAQWEEVGCPFCNSSSQNARLLEVFGYQSRYRYVRCQACGLAYQNPRPAYNADFIETAYEVYDTAPNTFQTRGELSEQGKIVYQEYAYILTEMESLLGRKGKLLEIGCNTGFFCKVALDQGWFPVGVEVSNSMAKQANQTYGVETRVGDWAKMKWSAPLDAIYCSHVIEHIPDPQAWMKRFKEVLTPDGIVCLSVPNMQSLDRVFKRFLKRLGLKKDRWQKWRTPDHLYEPCEKSMLRFIEASGFELLKQYSYPSEWIGKVSVWHFFYYMKMRWGAKSRYYFRAKL